MAATLKRGGLISTSGVFVAITLAVAAEDTAARAGSPEKSALAGPPAPLIQKKFAGDVFDLDQFALQIPLDDDGDGGTDVVAMPLLRNFEDPAFFHIDKPGEAIVFRTRCGDALMEGAAHPRCEMHELKEGTKEPASWSTRDGRIHRFSATLAFTRLPEDGSPVTAVSVWGEGGEAFAMRHEMGKIVMSRTGMEPLLLEETYVAGRPLEWTILVDKGRVRMSSGIDQIAEWPLEASGLQFRVGVFYESESPKSGDPESVAEVTVWKLYLVHQ